MTAFNGVLGGLYDKFIVTTPNASALWVLPLGSNQIMYLCLDLHYGDDDPLSWPQPYVTQYCHFPIIHSMPLSISDSHPEALLFWLPSKIDFYEADSMGEYRGPGFLLHHKFVWFQHWVNIVIEHGKSMTFSEGAEDWKHSYIVLLHDLLEHLQHLPMSLKKVQLSVQETQCTTIYLCMLIDYMLIYKPHMNAILDSLTESQKADHELMGVFTSDAQVMQSFLCAGIPVWIIRPIDQLSNIHINKTEHFKELHFFISLDQHCTKFHPIFKGHGLTAEKYYTFN